MQTTGQRVFEEPTGWGRVDRTLDHVRGQLATASTEAQYQAIGQFCRDTIISLAQVVLNPQKHRTQKGTVPSNADAEEMLLAYVTHELHGEVNEKARRLVKSLIVFANALTPKRTATFRDAALCAEATVALVNIIAVIVGRRS